MIKFLFFAILLFFIGINFVFAAPAACPANEICNPISNTSFVDFVTAIAVWVSLIAIPVAVVVIIYAGAIMLLSQGKPDVIKRGRSMLTYAVIGLAIILIGRGFFTLIGSIINLGK